MSENIGDLGLPVLMGGPPCHSRQMMIAHADGSHKRIVRRL